MPIALRRRKVHLAQHFSRKKKEKMTDKKKLAMGRHKKKK